MIPLNFNHFYCFYEVAKHGSFTAAARSIMVSQSALSIQVKQLEMELGGALFDRRKGGVDLTERGQAAFQVADRIFNEVDRLRATLQESERQIAGTVSIGTVNSIGIYMLPEILSDFKAVYPDARVKIDFKEADAVMELLYSGKVDFAIVPWNRKYADLTPVRLTRNKMFLVAPPDHPLAGRDRVPPRELENYTFVGFEEGMHTRTMMDALFKRMSLQVEYTIESANSATIKHMVMAGMGLAILPEVAVANDLRHGSLVRITVPSLIMAQDIMLYRKSRRTMSPTRAEFQQFLQDYFKSKPRRRLQRRR